MHYYQFNIADYRKDTAHLSPIEHYIYRTLIDWYYLDEKPIPNETEWVLRRLRLGLNDEEILLNVLSDFFVRQENYWHHLRIDSEISQYHANLEKNRRNGKLGGRPKKTQSVILANPNQSQKKANQELITNKPITNTKGSRLPKDWQPPLEYIDFCKKERPDLDANSVADEFKDYWISVAGAKGVKLDWFATWRNWVRNQRFVPKTKESQAWRTDDVAMLQKAKELGVSTTGKSRFEIIAAIDKKRGAV